MAAHVNILKLCVGADSVEDLLQWQQDHRHLWPEGRTEHVTRMWPKREAEVTGGSLYWVVKGSILCRQRILALEPRDWGDGVNRCALVLDAEVIRTAPALRRPFQGWRYLDPADSPPDLARAKQGEDILPPGLAEALAEFGWR